MEAKTKQKRKPLYRRVPVEKIRLQERDRKIIYEVFRYRFLNFRHIIALTGGQPAKDTKALAKPVSRRLFEPSGGGCQGISVTSKVVLNLPKNPFTVF
ncbi:hypothetical protein [Desulfosarcina sp. BuS5]|uniref:hypothetical protein n=1 Tax=Desulfosarcina sp. BuS5 TaxID=933262 RepID=UPI000489388C|nr:hypothetical protein [Desulfosarcina sp. BuS5]